ncbi:Hsp33 family molecular chaperone HslO [Neiella marina]|uniref:Hsp33 family molecular chaperone HslO n=1 Tax=Neiella marina TaxID=508461 RepID=UPI000B3D2792|nr:Hsp33 family molecular chaperone HslO [Neiella marina]
MQTNADQLHRYLFEQRNCRGELVQLHSTYARIIEGHNYPPVIAELLGEALSATCLLTATIKFEGEITLQIQGSGPLSLLVINGRNDQTMRGIARVQSHVGNDMTFKQLIGQGQMVITIAPDKGERYQGIVELSEETFSGCLEQYFFRSEQLATSLNLFADVESQQCGGILIQALPKQDNDDEDFSHLQVLASTLKGEELYQLPAEQVLHRLFHEEKVTLYQPQDVVFHCSCSRERSKSALLSMGKDELSQIFSEQEQVDIHCQYCNTHHVFSAEDFDELFGLTNKKIH